MNNQISVNNRTYSWPKKTTIVICLDGSEPGKDGYIEKAIEMGFMPCMKSIIGKGTYEIGKCAMPSFTNVNNLSIVTGTTPDVHGICANFFYNQDEKKETLMNDDSFLRAPTIFEAFEKSGANLAVITAKDKLKKLLGKNLKKSICFSAEKADLANLKDCRIENVLKLVGKPVPEVYSADLSEFIFAAAVKILERGDKIDLMYLSTTDYIQHKCAPGSDIANAFYQMIDSYIEKLLSFGCKVAFTADHGMKAKSNADGTPNVIYLQDLLNKNFPKESCNVICTITDPYVIHHGALGSFVTIYIENKEKINEIKEYIQKIEGIDVSLTKEEAVRKLNQPEDRIGDLVVTCKASFALGKGEKDHDLSQLKEPLRSHGGLDETSIPIFISDKLDESYKKKNKLHNYDIFDLALNYDR
jgi:phosphonoacetate hydrolase